MTGSEAARRATERGFILLFFHQIRREFGERAALYGCGILATSAGWLAYSHVAVTDIPLATTFSAALLC